MSAWPSVSSTVATWKPSIAACNAQIGSISVTTTRAPNPRSECAEPLPTSPYPHTTATLPATIRSVARLMPSASDSRQPYRLSNFDLVTESLTLIAGTSNLPASASWYRRCTPVVVSSDTPRHSDATFFQKPGRSVRVFFSRSLMTCSSWLAPGSSTHFEPSSISTPLWIKRVASPPSSTINSGPAFPGCVSASSVHCQYSSSVSPFHANTGTPLAAIAAAQSSWVEKMLHDAQRTDAPSAVNVSISTAVSLVMCSEPVTRTPFSGFCGA